jgi:chondroitin 6-sulfotransferase 3
VLLFFATKSTSYDDYKKEINPLKYNKYRNYYASSDQQQQVTQNLSVTIDDVLNYQRQQIAEEMQYYEYPNGRFGIEAKNLQELTMETGGTPMRSIILSTWRSGSTFLGDVLNSLPGNFYHYEPLLTYDINQVRGPPHDKPALKSLKKLLTCNYTGMDDYLDFGQSHNYLFTHNNRLWSQCHLFPSFCYQPKFLEPFCKLFPLQSMKVVRLRTRLAESLLKDSR